MDNPERLYHYTNVEALSLILKNQTIRLNSLDKMDDRQEKEIDDLRGAGSLCYVSSWTEDFVFVCRLYRSKHITLVIMIRLAISVALG